MTRPRLDLLKALGDNTRYAIYLELARSPAPLATADVAESLGLHPNTVRPHLERMRDVGLLEVRTEVRAGVGRPSTCTRLAPQAPSLGLEPPTFPMLARMLVRLAEATGASRRRRRRGRARAGQLDAGRPHRGRFVPRGPGGPSSTRSASIRRSTARTTAMTAVVAFAHCPFRELAEAHPDLVCALHRGMVEGFVGRLSATARSTTSTPSPTASPAR